MLRHSEAFCSGLLYSPGRGCPCVLIKTSKCLRLITGLRAAMGMHVDYVEMSPLETAVDGEQDRAEDSADEVAGFDEDL